MHILDRDSGLAARDVEEQMEEVLALGVTAVTNDCVEIASELFNRGSCPARVLRETPEVAEPVRDVRGESDTPIVEALGHAQELRNDPHRQWIGEFADRIEVRAALGFAQQLVHGRGSRVVAASPPSKARSRGS